MASLMQTDSLVSRIVTDGPDLFFNTDNWSSDDLLSHSFTFFDLVELYKKKKSKKTFTSFLMRKLNKKPKEWVEEFLKQKEYTDLQKYVLNQAVEKELVANADKIKSVADLVKYVGDQMFYVQFKKKSEEPRNMFAMLYDPEKFSEFSADKIDTSKDYVRLFDLDINEFRSMKINSIVKIARCVEATPI